MKIGRATAQRIVVELSGVISENINLIDDKSIIIASTDEKRIGTFHAGSRMIIEKRLKELVINDEYEYEGSFPGLNLPIEMNKKVVGVIGITGQYDEIKKYGTIIKKMTEILLLESELKDQETLSSTVRVRFINDWLFSENYCSDPLFVQQGKDVGINVEISRKLMVLAPLNGDLGEGNSRLRNLRTIENCLSTNIKLFDDSLLFNNGSKYVIMLPDCSDNMFYEFASKVQKKIFRECNVRTGVGLDSNVLSKEMVHDGYKRAEKALRISLKNVTHAPVSYRDLKLEIIYPELSEKIKKEFIDKIFANCSSKEICQYESLLRVYYDCNCSIKATGKQLFLHKNTIQYKLNKLWQQTGLDPRTAEGTALYYLALEFMKK